MLKFLDLYNECAGQPWSMFDNDAESVEDFESAMKISINKAISYLWNLHNWNFRKKTATIKTKKDKSFYNMPSGKIIKKTINGAVKYGVKYNGKFLSYAGDYELLEVTAGEPEKFYVDGDNIYIYPVPDNIYTITVDYLSIPYGLTAEGETIYELSKDDDYINIPERHETIFKNCVISLAMIYAIADESDENHSGYKKQYEDALNVLLNYCKNSIINRNIVW